MRLKCVKIYGDKVIVGFAGATADAFTLLERFEAMLERHSGQLKRAAVELAKEWRTDRVLRKLEAMLIVADAEASLLISGTGDVIDAYDDLIAIGSVGLMHNRRHVHCLIVQIYRLEILLKKV